jgi:hypothetical protein
MCPLTPFDVLRDVKLPAVDSSMILMESLMADYHRMTGMPLSWRHAAQVVDRIKRERGDRFWAPRPVPDPYAEVAFWLQCQGYQDDAVRVVVRHLEATGTARGCPFVAGEDVAILDAMVPVLVEV